MMRRILSIAVVACILPSAARAQDGPRWYEGHVSLGAGVSIFERSGSGTMAIYNLRADMPLYPTLLVEAGVSYARRGSDPVIGDIFIPSVQFQLQPETGRFQPYAGLGAGMTIEARKNGQPDDLSFAPSFAAGVRAAISQGTGLRFEGRLHGVGANFRGVYSEVTAGLSIAW